MKKPPSDERLRRILARLEARRAARGQAAEPAVVIGLPGELPSETSARLAAAGRQSSALIVPALLPQDEWARQCSRYQSWLLRRASDTEREPPSRAEIETAYRASMGSEPMPT